MTAPARERRTANELAAQRAGAAELRPDANAWEREVARATIAALDWVEGATDRSPVTGDRRPADDREIAVERIRAVDVEDLALRRGLDGTYPGMVGLVLSWFHRREFAEPPY